MNISEESRKAIIDNPNNVEMTLEIFLASMTAEELGTFRVLCESYLNSGAKVDLLTIYDVFAEYENDDSLKRLPEEWKQELMMRQIMDDPSFMGA